MAADRELLERLGTVPLFKGLSHDELMDVVERSRVVEFEAGHDIVEEGGGFVGFHLILEGQATVSQASCTVTTLGPGDSFGEISVIDGKPRSATVTTATPVSTLSLSALNCTPADRRPPCARAQDLARPVSDHPRI